MRIALIGSNYTTWAPVRPDTIYQPGRMVGGGETSMIYVSKELAKRGHEVTVYMHTDLEAEYDGVHWVPLDPRGNFRSKREVVDIAISYDVPWILGAIGSRVAVLENQCNDPDMNGQGRPIDAFVFKSNWHRDAVLGCRPTIPRDRSHVIGNGVDLGLYAQRESVPKIPGRIIWTSSPDRGLHHALEIFRRVQERVPHATFHIYYDFSKAFEGGKWGMDFNTECIWRTKRLLEKTPNVVHVGPVDKVTLARAQMEAELLLLPEETNRPSEGFGISLAEAMAAGTLAMISDNDALPELWGDVAPTYPLPIQYDRWADEVVDFLSDADKRTELASRALSYVRQFSWDRIGDAWDTLLRELYHSKPCPFCGVGGEE